MKYNTIGKTARAGIKIAAFCAALFMILPSAVSCGEEVGYDEPENGYYVTAMGIDGWDTDGGEDGVRVTLETAFSSGDGESSGTAVFVATGNTVREAVLRAAADMPKIPLYYHCDLLIFGDGLTDASHLSAVAFAVEDVEIPLSAKAVSADNANALLDGEPSDDGDGMSEAIRDSLSEKGRDNNPASAITRIYEIVRALRGDGIYTIPYIEAKSEGKDENSSGSGENSSGGDDENSSGGGENADTEKSGGVIVTGRTLFRDGRRLDRFSVFDSMLYGIIRGEIKRGTILDDRSGSEIEIKSAKTKVTLKQGANGNVLVYKTEIILKSEPEKGIAAVKSALNGDIGRLFNNALYSYRADIFNTRARLSTKSVSMMKSGTADGGGADFNEIFVNSEISRDITVRVESNNKDDNNIVGR